MIQNHIGVACLSAVALSCSAAATGAFSAGLGVGEASAPGGKATPNSFGASSAPGGRANPPSCGVLTASRLIMPPSLSIVTRAFCSSGVVAERWIDVIITTNNNNGPTIIASCLTNSLELIPAAARPLAAASTAGKANLPKLASFCVTGFKSI